MPRSIAIKIDTKSNWQAKNPILDDGEFAYCSDDKDFRIGDGVTPWMQLENYNNTED